MKNTSDQSAPQASSPSSAAVLSSARAARTAYDPFSPREPVAYPKYRPRPANARRPVYVIEERTSGPGHREQPALPEGAHAGAVRGRRELSTGSPEPQMAGEVLPALARAEMREPVAKPRHPMRADVESRAAGRAFGERSRLRSSHIFDPRHAVPTRDRRGRISFITYTFS